MMYTVYQSILDISLKPPLATLGPNAKLEVSISETQGTLRKHANSNNVKNVPQKKMKIPDKNIIFFKFLLQT